MAELIGTAMLPKRSVLVVLCLLITLLATTHGYLQEDTDKFVQDFPKYVARAYTALDEEAPIELHHQCRGLPFLHQADFVTVKSNNTTILASQVQSQCETNSVCVIEKKTLKMDSSLVVHALIIRNGGTLLWNNDTQKNRHQWLCAGYVAVEVGGSFEMNIPDDRKKSWIFIADNGAVHPKLRNRAFGAAGDSISMENMQPRIHIQGRELFRTWSVLKQPLKIKDTVMELMHNPFDMGWKIGDRIAIAPTDDLALGEAQAFQIVGFGSGNTIILDKPSVRYHEAKSIQDIAFIAAEVVNLSRNVVITGDDFTEVKCDPALKEVFEGYGTSTQGCMCTSKRKSCTVGLHTVHMHGGVSQIEHVRIEKCGQRGVEGKYCLHFHHLRDCPNCRFRKNAVEFSQQRGIIVHGTHRSKVEHNVLYDVRGANLYVEDGNEIYNYFAYNVAICPWKFGKERGCTLPGTSNDQSDTSLNQAGIYMASSANDLIGNRMANHFNGMFLFADYGRGSSKNAVCAQNTPFGRWEGNVFHSNGRFGTYTLHDNYPVHNTGLSLASNGLTERCDRFTEDGRDNGMLTSFRGNIDYGNAFVGHYEAGDIQYNSHLSFQNLNVLYWKETKSFANGCSAHIQHSIFANGTVALPDSLGSFIIEQSSLHNVLMEANHHCGIGGTGFLCMPHYVLHKVDWNGELREKWVSFTNGANKALGGGIFSLSQEDAALNSAGLGGRFLPVSYQSLVSQQFPYLLGTGECVSSTTLRLSERYEKGILCKVPLRALKIYSKNAQGKLSLRVWKANKTDGEPIAKQLIPLYSSNSWKQGFRIAVIPGPDFYYRISLDGRDIPSDWIIDFGDATLNNRWGVDELFVDIQGRNCGGVIRSDHDRRFLTSDINGFVRDGKGWEHGACSSFSSMFLTSCPGDSLNTAGITDCDNICVGEWPYGCNANLHGKVRYMCSFNGACHYSESLEDIVPPGFCVYKGPKMANRPPQPSTLSTTVTGVSNVSQPSIVPNISNGNFSACKQICPGIWPYGCNANLPGKMYYMCNARGDCHYAESSSETIPSGFCIFNGLSVDEHINTTSLPVTIQKTSKPMEASLNPYVHASAPCEHYCVGEWPYGCNDALPNVVNYMCNFHGSCHYSTNIEEPMPEGFCNFKGPFVSPFSDGNSAPCSNGCAGKWPYGCSTQLPGIMNYMCNSIGSCHYSTSSEESVPPGFCVFKGPLVNPIFNSCNGYCVGDWPYGCNSDLSGKVNYMCDSRGACHYSTSIEEAVPPGFCVFKGPFASLI